MNQLDVWEESTIWAYVLDELPPDHKQIFEALQHNESLLRTRVLVEELLAGEGGFIPPFVQPDPEASFQEIRRLRQTDTVADQPVPYPIQKKMTSTQVAIFLILICLGITFAYLSVMAWLTSK